MTIEDDTSSVSNRNRVARAIAIFAVLAVALVFGFGTESINSGLEKLLGRDFRRAIRILSRLWFYSTPVGELIGVLLAGC